MCEPTPAEHKPVAVHRALWILDSIPRAGPDHPPKPGPDIKNKSRKYLESQGYQLVASNISGEGLLGDFEDWWIHPELVDPAKVAIHTDVSDSIKDYAWYLYNRIPEVLKNTTWTANSNRS